MWGVKLRLFVLLVGRLTSFVLVSPAVPLLAVVASRCLFVCIVRRLLGVLGLVDGVVVHHRLQQFTASIKYSHWLILANRLPTIKINNSIENY
jgi:hypothetical protein